MSAEQNHERVLIVDFGSQVTQLIARRLRESGVYCEIHPYDKVAGILDDLAPKAVILSGGPASVHEAESPAAPQQVFELGVPVLGICYGEMTMAAQLGGAVEGGHDREFVEEAFARVDCNKIQPQLVAEILLHVLEFVLAQDAVVDEHACELITDRTVNERRGHRRVDAAGEAADHLALADLLADPPDHLLAERRHRPVAR